MKYSQGSASLATLLLLSALGLAGCNGFPGSESGDLASTRPTAQLSGYVVDDALRGALVNVYAFDGGVRGALLGTTTTAADGAYTLTIDAVRNRPVLIEARGGSYVELATGVEVNLKEDEVLRAAALVQAGKPLSLMVTPLTHLAAALTEYRIAQGMAVEAAIDSANDELQQLFGFNVVTVYPRSIADQGNTAGLSDDRLYGFYTASLSSWSKRISEQNGLAPHTVYTSIALSQLLYNDMAADGLLDGNGRSKASSQPTALAAGVVVLGPTTYRLALAQNMLAMAAGSINATAISVDTLLPRASALANSSHRIFAGEAPRQPEQNSIQFSSDENPDNYRSGVFNYAITLGSPEMISGVRVEIDGAVLPVTLVPGAMTVPIDTTRYADGEHSVRVIAKDWLGNVVASHAASFKFDNTSPHVNVTSNLYTNKEAYALRGTLGDNASGIQRFEVQGLPITIANDNSWSLNLTLVPGNNPVSVLLQDRAGNKFVQQLNIVLDQTAPLVDTSAGHGPARFSNGAGQPVSRVLADSNDDVPVYQESNRLDLNGIAINRAALQENGIPYFAFKVSDPVVNGVASADDELSVNMRYEKNGQVVADWKRLSSDTEEYLVPLASETLHSAWSHTVPSERHVVRVQAVDGVGNVSEKMFSFKMDVVVSDVVIGQIEEPSSALFQNTVFSARASLNDMTFAALNYTLTNANGKAIYVSMSDDGGHSATRDYEKLVRENKVRLKTSTDWLIGVAQNMVNFCDGTDNVVVWQLYSYPTAVFNYTAGDWVAVNRPAPLFGQVENVTSDAPTAATPEAWGDVPDFDNDFFNYTHQTTPQGTVTLTYDYRVSLDTFQDEPASVMNWRLEKDGKPVRTCSDERRSFKQRDSYSYVSEPGYPADKRSTASEQQAIIVAGFTVMNNTTSTEIIPVSGWYRIPAGHAVTITKRVHTPAMTVDNDVDVANSTTPAIYTPLLYDKRISWSVQRALRLTAVHDAGVANIFAMTPKQTSTGAGTVKYSIAR